MKLRIKDQTIRLRLSQSEVSELAEKGIVYHRTEFPQAAIIYGIEQGESNICTGSFDQQQIKLVVSQKILQDWCRSDQVGIDFVVRTSSDVQLLVLIEKDFKCMLDRPAEDESDLFPNPQASDA